MGKTRLKCRSSLTLIAAFEEPALLLTLPRLRCADPSWLVTEELEDVAILLREAELVRETEATGHEAAVFDGARLISRLEVAGSTSLDVSGGEVADRGEEAPLVATSPKMRARAAL